VTPSRFRRDVDLVGFGFWCAIVGGAGAGALYGIGAAGLAVGSMARARMLRGVDRVLLGLVLFSGVGALYGAVSGAFGGLLVGIVVAPAFVVWLLRPSVRALPPALRIRRARVVALLITFAVVGLPVLWLWFGHGDAGTPAIFGIPTLAALGFAPVAGARVARRFDARIAES
jgi:hypothetical protein